MPAPRLWAITAITAIAPFVALPGPAPAQEPDRVVAYAIVDGREIPRALTGQPGNPEAGRQLYFDRDLTGCSGCHGSPGGPGAEADPDAGGAPALSGLTRRMNEGAIRLWLVAPQVIRPGTTMPGYYTLGQRTDPKDPRYGEPLLSAGEIEDIVAYLMRQGAR